MEIEGNVTVTTFLRALNIDYEGLICYRFTNVLYSVVIISKQSG